MTNEEIIEELYWAAHISGVFNEFSTEVTSKLLDKNEMDRISVVESVYYQYVNNGLISKEGQLRL